MSPFNVVQLEQSGGDADVLIDEWSQSAGDADASINEWSESLDAVELAPLFCSDATVTVDGDESSFKSSNNKPTSTKCRQNIAKHSLLINLCNLYNNCFN